MTRRIKSNVQNEKLVEERRERIIKAAVKVIRRTGFHLATTKDIAEEADLTQSNLYNYVRSKNDVLFLVCEHLNSLYQKAFDAAVAQYDDPRDQLIGALRAVVLVMSARRDELQLLYLDTHALEKRDLKLILASIAKFIQSFETLIGNYETKYGKCLVGNRRIAANFLSFVPAIFALRSWDLDAHAKREEWEDATLAFLLTGLGIPLPKPAAKRRGD